MWGKLDVDEVFDESMLQEVEEEDEDALEEVGNTEEVGISVHALSGEVMHETIKVQGESRCRDVRELCL